MARTHGRAHTWRAVLTTPVGLTAAVLLVAVAVLAVLGPALWSTSAEAVDTSAVLATPSPEHWAGTDNLGRDILARTLVATRLSMVLAVCAIVVAVSAGLLLGAAPYLLGGRLGRLVAAAVNVAVAFPGLLLALFFAVVFGVGATGAVMAIGLAGAPLFARLVHTLVSGIAARDFVAAAQVAGIGRTRVLVRHVLPNIAEPLVVNATISAGTALLSFAGLSFLGLGVQSPSFDWGRLLYDGAAALYLNPAAALAPGAAVLLAGLAFNLVGESVAKGLGVDGLGVEGLGVPLGSGRWALPGRSPRNRPGTTATDVPDPADDRAEDAAGDVVLAVRDLAVSFPGPSGPVQPVRGVSFDVRRGEAVGIVGESGCGKSLTALAVTRL